MLPSRILWRRERFSTAGTLVLGLSLDSAELFARVDARIDTMVRCGFADEVRALLDRGYSPSLPSMSSIGYREMADCVGGASDLQTAVARIRRETRRLVRRQRAWFRQRMCVSLARAREPLSALDRSAMLLDRD
jgi:tRNA dimethylallyltransferase